MEVLRSIAQRFPQRELEIRRRCARDAKFASVCSDYEEAASALQHWRQAAVGDPRVQEYEQLVAELAAEILAELATVDGGRRQAGAPD